MLLFVLGTMAAAQAEPPRLAAPIPARCANRLTHAAGSAGALARKLDELPPGQAMLAVNKSVDGCPVAVLVRRDGAGKRMTVPIGPAGPVRLPARSQPQRGLEGDR